MAGYVFLSNSTKPTAEQQNSREPISLTNVSRPCLKAALDMGYDVFFGVNRAEPEGLKCELPVKAYDSHTYRSITAFKDNKIAFNNLKKIVKENDIEVIHCNTPVGGLIGRLIGRKYRIKQVIYTVHGFHFYKGAPLFNRTVLKWAEMIMAHWTDAIITMNEEDFRAAEKFRLKKGGKVYKVHGVGIDTEQYITDENIRNKKREELGLKESDIALISMGDLIGRKNYDTAVRAVAGVENGNIHYFICGKGPEENNLKSLADTLGIKNQIHFLGFRSDIRELLSAADIFLFTTKQEGLPRSMMEAMASGLPCVASDIRGNTDLIENDKNGFLCSPCDSKQFADAISKLSENRELREKMSKENLIKIKEYDISVVEKEIENIYSEVLNK